MALLIDTLLKMALIAATGFLFAIVIVAYLRVRSKRLLFIAAGFAVFFPSGSVVHARDHVPVDDTGFLR